VTIRELRVARGLTQRQFANRVDVSTECVRRWERGISRPTKRHVQQIADVCGVAVANVCVETGELVGEERERKRAEAQDVEPTDPERRTGYANET